jgi:hypothetical protein
VTKPKLFDEAIHFRARAGTKARIEKLRGSMRQGDFVRLLLEEGLERCEKAAASSAPKSPTRERNTKSLSK